MGLYEIDNDGIVQYKQINAGKEKEIEDLLEKHPEIIGKDIMIIGRQVQANSMGIIDLLGIDKAGRIVVVEIKKGTTPKDVVSQTLRYAAWAEDVSYDELNQILKKNNPNDGKDLYKKIESRFGTVPSEFNASQRMYMVSEEISQQTSDVCAYLNRKGVMIGCMQIKFYESRGKRFVGIEMITSEDLDESDDVIVDNVWEHRLENAEDNNKKIVLELMSKIKRELKCHGAKQNRWYKFSTSDKIDGKGFAFITINKKTSHFCFRYQHDSFDVNDERVRQVNRWFFKEEGRISIKPENIALSQK